MRVPVIATKTRGAQEAVLNGKTGLLVPLNDVEALSTAMTKLITQPSLGRELGTAGEYRAKEMFDQTALIRRVMKRYELLIE
jgi:glycosyltransferase involved in cell wall biosynthesis